MPGQWYTDSRDPDFARWRDESGWTEHTVRKSDWLGRGTPPDPTDLYEAPPGPSSGRRVLAAGATLALVVLLATGWFVFRDDNDAAKSTSPTMSTRSTVEAPKFVGSRSALASWLRDDGRTVSRWVAASTPLAELSQATASVCEPARRQLQSSAPKPPAILKAVASSPDPVIRELTSNDLHAKIDFLAACLGSATGRPSVSEVGATHASLQARLTYLSEQAKP